VEATRLIPGLWIGSAPEPGSDVADHGFTVLVLAAREYQPPSTWYPGVVVLLRVPLADERPTEAEVDAAYEGALEIARLYLAGYKILITCGMGRNRSGLVTALALHFITGESPMDCGRYVQKRRKDPLGFHALTNEHFWQVLRNATTVERALAER